MKNWLEAYNRFYKKYDEDMEQMTDLAAKVAKILAPPLVEKKGLKQRKRDAFAKKQARDTAKAKALAEATPNRQLFKKSSILFCVHTALFFDKRRICSFLISRTSVSYHEVALSIISDALAGFLAQLPYHHDSLETMPMC